MFNETDSKNLSLQYRKQEVLKSAVLLKYEVGMIDRKYRI